MRRVLCSLAILLLCTAGTAHALEGLYVAPKLGYSLLTFDDPRMTEDFGKGDSFTLYNKDATEGIIAGGLAIGYDFARRGGLPVRVELEGMLREAAKKSTDIFLSGVQLTRESNVQTLFANVYLDFPMGWALTPYVGGGIGMASVDYGITLRERDGEEFDRVKRLAENEFFNESSKRTNFAWNIGAGLVYAFTPNVALDLNYRYVDAGKGRVGIRDEEISGRFQSDIFLNEFLLALRYTF